MRSYCPPKVTSLKPNQVFVFGSNLQGFHGAGAAGYAQRGTEKNTWRQDKQFLAALRSGPNDPKRHGKWSVLGEGIGFQEGREGKSYAIATVTRAGRKRSMPLSKILAQLKELGEFAKEHQELNFLVAVGGGGLNGWTVEEMQEVYRKWCEEDPPTDNVYLLREYEFRI